ncbi:MAG: hypothetical protein IPH34_15710 [Chitinophagaceae bacterium]|nr:hypothetical protein [Chitinophagaceae bacterium]MBK8311328.1 hypothetical protein [Chitinophagaceae bacterium]MBP6476908.1 hypothetical protein [Chitinophagaceae bacterium]MBP7106975.1 hypothetical protein [Chitinophagaceae bacterium]MBP7314152.1 hypothetical protein [Chitinophagaceae bacterium]
MKKLLLFYILLSGCTSQAQKQTFDLISYTTPKGWKVDKKESTVAFTKEDNTKGIFCVITLYKTVDAGDNPKENFDNTWESLVKETFTDAQPEMQPVSEDKGWTAESGYASFEKEGISGIVLLASTTGFGKLANILILTNTDIYEKEMTAFLESIDVKKPTTPENKKQVQEQIGNASNSPVIGLWGFYNSESYGNMLTGGYFRKEYTFYTDGSYQYRRKDWSTTVKEILFVYETGTYTIIGNQVTISPKQGKKEWWSKAASQQTNEWGKRLRVANQKLEKITYNFEIKYLSGMEKNYLMLRSANPTERDGKKSNQNNSLHEFSYSQRKLNESLIDSPPGTKN